MNQTNHQSRQDGRMLGAVKAVRATIKLERHSYPADQVLDRIVLICDKAIKAEKERNE